MFLMKRVLLTFNICPTLVRFNNVKFSAISGPSVGESDDFRVLDLKKKKSQGVVRRKQKKPVVMPPRSERMPVDQDWVSVWPGSRSFHPATVPLPVRQGFPVKEGEAAPGKFSNAELMKVPNFLHLTPPAIRQHCAALKKFCTLWPCELETDVDCERHFPLEVSTSDYCHSSPSIRDPMSRIVTLKVKLSSLPLNAHAKDKLLRLVAERYDPASDYITILTDRCPTRRQNYDYAQFLLAALFHESWKIEDWEKEKQLQDMELFDWQSSASRASVHQLSTRLSQFDQEIVLLYGQAVTDLIDKGEDIYTINKYKEKAKKLLSLLDEPHLNQKALQ